MSSLSKRACQSARYGISGTNQPLMLCSGQHPWTPSMSEVCVCVVEYILLKFVKDIPPLLQLFFSSACRILLDLWTFSPVGARARSRKICMCDVRARARARQCVPLTNVVGRVAGPVRGVCVTLPTTKSSCRRLVQAT